MAWQPSLTIQPDRRYGRNPEQSWKVRVRGLG